jgi:hypothetical protein
MDDQYSSEKMHSHRSLGEPGLLSQTGNGSIDAHRLNTAMQILQSQLGLAGGQLSQSENAELLTSLYEILGPGGSHVDPIAMVTFNLRLAERLHKTTNAVNAMA